MRALRCILALVAAVWVAGAGAQSPQASTQAPEGPARTALRVCQDPNNLPFSNSAGAGIENRLAELMGKAMNLPVSYFSFPQRMGFIRNTLRYKLPGEDFPCDIVLGVPADYGQVSATKPYYRSTYAMVLRPFAGLEQVRSVADLLKVDPALLKRLRIGIFDRSPASEWLHRHGLIEQGVPYRMLDADPGAYAGKIIENDLAQGELDAVIVWGPVAGYFAKRVTSVPLRVMPMKSEPGVKFDYAMAMGVRHGEREWKQQIEALIDSRRADITAVLREFGVPLVNEAGDPLPE